MDVNWTTVIASALTACIISGATFITNRYLGRILDKIEKNTEKDKDGK
jgi:4-hydroxybenzoate polyprenyltransferase